jgi:hypothetical protein
MIKFLLKEGLLLLAFIIIGSFLLVSWWVGSIYGVWGVVIKKPHSNERGGCGSVEVHPQIASKQ